MKSLRKDQQTRLTKPGSERRVAPGDLIIDPVINSFKLVLSRSDCFIIWWDSVRISSVKWRYDWQVERWLNASISSKMIYLPVPTSTPTSGKH